MKIHLSESEMRQYIYEALQEFDLSQDSLCNLLGIDKNNTDLSPDEVNELLTKAKADTVRAGRAQRIVQPNYDNYALSHAERRKIADYYMYLYAQAMGRNYTNAATEITDDMPQKRKDAILYDREEYRDRNGKELTKDTPNSSLFFSPMTHMWIEQGSKVGYKYADDANSIIFGTMVGKNNDIFMASHFAPTSPMDGVKALYSLGEDSMPAILMITGNLADMVRKAAKKGWVDTGIKFSMMTNAGRAVKYLFVNQATTNDDILDAFTCDTPYSDGLHSQMTSTVNKLLSKFGKPSISTYQLLRTLRSGVISGDVFVMVLKMAFNGDGRLNPMQLLPLLGKLKGLVGESKR